MDRREAVLRELNLYPLWQRRGEPAPGTAQEPMPVTAGEADIQQSTIGTAALNPSCVDSKAITPGSATDHGIGKSSSTGWPELKQQVHDCIACRLRAGCAQTVFGVGDESADWLFVGEGPGVDEDARGEPFVGQAGKLLDNMLLAIKLKRGENVYVANIVKCRPPNNRNPAADEIAQCLPYLHRQIELIQPKLIVALGKTAATSLLGREATLASLRGTLHDYHSLPLIVTYHPAYLLRSPSEKIKAWQDLCLAVKIMGQGNSR